MYKNILYNDLSFTKKRNISFSAQAQDLISKLLRKDPENRIGVGKRDAEDIKNHAWFNGLDWEQLSEKKIEPPYLPSKEEIEAYEFFDSGLEQSWELEQMNQDESIHELFSAEVSDAERFDKEKCKTAGNLGNPYEKYEDQLKYANTDDKLTRGKNLDDEQGMTDTPKLGRGSNAMENENDAKKKNPIFNISDFTYVNSMITDLSKSNNLSQTLNNNLSQTKKNKKK